MKNVLRMKAGEKITVNDGTGQEYDCQVAEFLEDTVRVEILERRASSSELPSRLVLFQGLPKGDKMELIIQKAVELGVSEVVPVASRRCVVKLDAKKEASKIKRWQAIAESAAKQSGRSYIPEVKPVVSYAEALRQAKELDVRLIPYEKAGEMLSGQEITPMEQTRRLLSKVQKGQSVGAFIGPEGGLEESEVELALKNGVQPITLGKRILRTETAGLCILSVLMFQLEE
jgi:16S rRNA (uracil1498-N3)-methyltransferase